MFKKFASISSLGVSHLYLKFTPVWFCSRKDFLSFNRSVRLRSVQIARDFNGYLIPPPLPLCVCVGGGVY